MSYTPQCVIFFTFGEAERTPGCIAVTKDRRRNTCQQAI